MAAPKILLVDDDDGFRYAALKALEKAGFTVAAERDFVGALKVLQSESPIDLLLTDVAMPTLHGFALVRMARVRRPGIKIIMSRDSTSLPRKPLARCCASRSAMKR